MKPFAWKLTSPWLRVPVGARKVRMIFKGRWTVQGDAASVTRLDVEESDKQEELP